MIYTINELQCSNGLALLERKAKVRKYVTAQVALLVRADLARGKLYRIKNVNVVFVLIAPNIISYSRRNKLLL